MNFKNLYLIKGKIRYDGKDYDFKTLKLVKMENIALFTPIDIKHFSEFNLNQVYMFDEKNNYFISNFDEEYAISLSGTYLFSIYTINPILMLTSTPARAGEVFISVVSKSLFNYVIDASSSDQYCIFLIYKYAFVRVKTNSPTDFSIIFYEPETPIPYQTINQNQIFDLDIIEL